MAFADLVALLGLAVVGCTVLFSAHDMLHSADASTRRPALLLALALSVLVGVLVVLATSHPVKSVGVVAGAFILAIGGLILYTVFQAHARAVTTLAAAPTQTSEGWRRWILLVLLASGAILVGYVGVVDLAADGSTPEAPLPPSGSVINAANGQVTQHVPIRTTHQAVQIAGGDIFRACNLSTEVPCDYPLHQSAIKAHPGDIVKFKFRLHDPYTTPLPYTKVYVVWNSGSRPEQVNVELIIEWPTNAGTGRPPYIIPVTITLSRHGIYNGLAYIPGSTMLLDRNSRALGRLPDGIMENGIALTNVGSPASCFYCDLKYVRFVSFKARVNQAR